MHEESRCSRLRRCGRSMAFTLVELLLVVIIIAILAGAMTVSLTGRTQHYELAAAANDLVEAISSATANARLSQTDHRIAILDSGKAYRVEALAAGSASDYQSVAGMAGASRSLGDQISFVGVSTDNVTYDAIPGELQFDANGDGFSGFIQLQDSRGNTKTIVVSATTGQANLID